MIGIKSGTRITGRFSCLPIGDLYQNSCIAIVVPDRGFKVPVNVMPKNISIFSLLVLPDLGVQSNPLSLAHQFIDKPFRVAMLVGYFPIFGICRIRYHIAIQVTVFEYG